MAYLEYPQYAKLKKFSLKTAIPMTQLIREAIDARISTGDKYVLGYNAGLKDAIRIVEENKASKMRFPSGKSFAELITEDIEKSFATEGDDEKTGDAGATEGRTGDEEQGDPRLGI